MQVISIEFCGKVSNNVYEDLHSNSENQHMKPSLLFLAGHLPASNGTQAGMKSSYHLCRVLARHFDLHLLCFVTGGELPLYKPGPSAIFHSQEILPVNNRLRAIGAFTAPGLPLAISARNSAVLRGKLSRLLSEHDFKAAILDHSAMWQYADAVSDIPVVCGVAHDVMSQQWERRAAIARGVAAPFLRAEAARIRKWEAVALTKLTMAVPYSAKDAALLSALNPDSCLQSIQPWFSNLIEQKRSSEDIRPSRKNVVFWGALSREENQDCVRFTLDEILPIVRRQVPDVQFYIAGAASESLKAAWARQGVIVTGFVKDVGTLFAEMDIALLPLRLGAGIKIKVLECMSAGLAVVTTPVGIEGIPARQGDDYLLGSSAQELAAHVITLLSKPDACQTMGRNAQEFIKMSFDFDASAEEFAAALVSRIG